MNSMICPYCGNLITYNSCFDVFYCRKCGGFFKQATVMECNDLNKPLTNAQKIRSMSDEELANIIECPYGNPYFDEHLPCKGSCHDCLLIWLQRPVEEDDHA